MVLTQSGFQITSTNYNRSRQRDEPITIPSNYLFIRTKRGKNHAYMVELASRGFASHWLKNWRESLKPITRRSNRNLVITFDSHLKTTLSEVNGSFSIVLILKPRLHAAVN